jgi:hypothetical protein
MVVRVTLDRFVSTDPRMLDPLESLNAAYGLGFLRGAGIPYADLESEANEFCVTVRQSAWRDQWLKGIAAGRGAH